MKQINFIPLQIRERQLRQRQLAVALFAALLGAAASAALWLPLRSEVLAARQRLSDSASSVANLTKPQPTDISAVVAQKQMALRIGQLNALAKTEINWPRTFRQISAALPRNIRLDSYSVANAAGVFSITMTGQAPSNYEYAVYVESFKSTPFLKNAKEQGYAYAPLTGAVTFTTSLTVPLASVDYSAP